MFYKKGLYLAFFLTAAFSISAPGQIVDAKFVSYEGGFTIDLPSTIDQGVRPVGNISHGAATYSWKLPDGDFTIGFVDGIRPYQDGFDVLNELSDKVTLSLSKTGAKITERIEFNYDGHPGIQVTVNRGKGPSINRFILAGNRLYTLVADHRPDSGKIWLRVMDSFEIIDAKALIA
jgi:hypothetical protein